MIKDNNGNMPFAVIAVMILLLASVAGAVMVDHSRSERAIDNTVSGTKAIDESLDDIGSYINQELGVIILDISKDDSLGSLDDRAEVFEERADLWIDYRFPINSGGVTTELIDYDVDLEAESMELFTDESAIGGYIPSYLHGTGVITVRAHSDHGSTVRTISISTDGSYALPLASEQGSIFEMMIRDGGISISQMMTYELQSLAQYRVMNGYGSQTQFGSKGTDSIITRADVQDAYERSLDVIKAICFRDPQTDLLYSDVDLADLIVGESLDVDIDSFRGQMLMSVVDDIILKWYDYLCIGDVWDRLHPNKGISKAFQNALIRFLNGDDAFSAEGYIVGKMEYYGVDEILYRTPGSGTTTLTMDDVVITVENPTIDIMDQNWIKWFSLNYDSKKDAFKDSMRSALIEASKRIASNGSGIISIQIDPYDDISFIDQITDAYLSSLDGSFENEIIESMSSSTFYDPFYASIANTVMQHASSLLDTEELVNRLVIALEEAGIALENDVNSCPEIVKAIHEYESKVYSDLSVYELLTTIEGSGPGLFNDILTSIAQYDIEKLNLKHLMTERASILIEEMVANMRIEAYSGLTEMPSGNSFILVDGSENRTAERLFLELYTDPIIDEPRVLKSKCTHMTGLFEDFCAGYSTTFQVSLRDLIEYRVSSMSTFSSSMDSSITAASKGMIVNDLCIEISVASAWPLIGVEYSASDTIFSDAWIILCEYFEPFIEPLREILEMVMDAIDVLNRCLIEISRYVTEIVTKLYEKMMEPMQRLADLFELIAGELIDDGLLDLFFSLNLTEQKVGFHYLGYTFELKLNLASLTGTVKTLFIASLSGPVADLEFDTSITVKVKGAINLNNVFVTGKATVKSDDWKVNIALDPLMKSSKHLMTLSASIKDTDITLVLPELEDYNEIGITLSRIPGIGQTLSNIPIPGLGVNVGLDAGISLKYSAPTQSGLIINEFETNPAGDDKGKEWVELLNNSDKLIELDGYTLVASSDRTSKKMTLSGSISPGEFLVITPTFSMVNTAGKMTKNGEGLTLKDPDGAIVDKTGVRKDNNDDGRTWQRVYDGSGEWEFKEGTMGKSNGSYVSSKLLTIEEAKDIIKDSVSDAFDKVGAITDMESLQDVIRETVKSAVGKVIKKVSGCLVEASVFVKVDVMDPSSSASVGVRVALRTDSDLVEDVLKYIAGKVMSIAMSMKNPYRIDPVGMFTDNIDLEITMDTGIQYPRVLARTLEDVPKVDLGVTFRTNISAITKVLGKDMGKPEFQCGVRVIDCPLSIIPSKLSPKKGMDHDMWLFKLTIQWD